MIQSLMLIWLLYYQVLTPCLKVLKLLKPILSDWKRLTIRKKIILIIYRFPNTPLCFDKHSFLLHPFPQANLSSGTLSPPPMQNIFHNSTPTLFTASRRINNSLSLYIFLYSEPQLSKSKEFNNRGLKVQVNRAFKSYSAIILLSKKQ